MTGGQAPAWTGILFRREVLQQVGFIDPETLGPSDLDYTLRLAATFPFVVERRPAAVFTLNASSFSATQPLSSFWPGWQKMFRNIENLKGLATSDRECLLLALHADAQRMLFRRGGNAIAAGRYEFARDAARALVDDYGMHARAGMLRATVFSCEWIPGFQRVATAGYRSLERRIVKSRYELQERYGYLLRPE